MKDKIILKYTENGIIDYLTDKDRDYAEPISDEEKKEITIDDFKNWALYNENMGKGLIDALFEGKKYIFRGKIYRNEEWKDDVPNYVYKYIINHHLDERIKEYLEISFKFGLGEPKKIQLF